MDIDISAIHAAYNSFLFKIYWSNIGVYESFITGLGDIPEYPIICNSNANYNNVTTSRNTWKTSKSGYQSQLLDARNLLNQLELEIVNLMPPNQWVKLTGLNNWTGANTQWVAVKNNKQSNADNNIGSSFKYILTSQTEPEEEFPNV